ncbi:DNA-binding CsgD family transcriptional regulator [Bradyrhizobium sp. USDA 4354]
MDAIHTNDKYLTQLRIDALRLRSHVSDIVVMIFQGSTEGPTRKLPERFRFALRAVTATTDAESVLDALDRLVGPYINLLSMWPAELIEEEPSHVFGGIMYSKTVPAAYKEDRRVMMEKHGPSLLAHTAASDPAPFTFTDVMRRMQPTGSDRLVFDMLQEHGFRDGFYCPQGSWMVSFTSRHVLTETVLTRELRMTIDAAANLAVYRMKEVMANATILEAADLSPRELTALRHFAAGERPPAIAERMRLSENSVRTYLKRAQKKLNAKSQVHAAVLAVRQRPDLINNNCWVWPIAARRVGLLVLATKLASFGRYVVHEHFKLAGKSGVAPADVSQEGRSFCGYSSLRRSILVLGRDFTASSSTQSNVRQYGRPDQLTRDPEPITARAVPIKRCAHAEASCHRCGDNGRCPSTFQLLPINSR